MKYLAIIVLLLVPLLVFGQTVCPDGRVCPPGEICICNPLPNDDIVEVVNGIIRWVFFIVITIAPIMYIIAGFRFLTAAGDPEKINTAKKMVLWVTIGIIIAGACYGIVNLLREILGI